MSDYPCKYIDEGMMCHKKATHNLYQDGKFIGEVCETHLPYFTDGKFKGVTSKPIRTRKRKERVENGSAKS